MPSTNHQYSTGNYYDLLFEVSRLSRVLPVQRSEHSLRSMWAASSLFGIDLQDYAFMTNLAESV